MLEAHNLKDSFKPFFIRMRERTQTCNVRT